MWRSSRISSLRSLYVNNEKAASFLEACLEDQRLMNQVPKAFEAKAAVRYELRHVISKVDIASSEMLLGDVVELPPGI